MIWLSTEYFLVMGIRRIPDSGDCMSLNLKGRAESVRQSGTRELPVFCHACFVI